MPASGSVRLVFAGDIMLAETPGELIAASHDPFANFAPFLSDADYTIGNLECVVAHEGEAYDKPYVFLAHPRVLSTLRRHFDIVSLANNHTGDFGHRAFLEQLGHLQRADLSYFGGGKDCVEARQPIVINHAGMRIAMLAYNDFKPRAFEAGPTWPGVAWSVDEQVLADIRAARSQHHADVVIPFMHWGWEYEPANERQQALARLMIDAGADMVVGGHPHVTQGAEYFQGKPIIYSLGNFVFNGFDPGPSRIGWVLRVRLDRQGVVEWNTLVAKIDDLGQPILQPDVPSPSGQRGDPEIHEITPARDTREHPKDSRFEPNGR